MYEFQKNVDHMVENAINIAANYIDQNHIKSLVIGMSGGIDSTLTAAVAYEIMRRFSGKIKVIGYTICIESKSDELNRGIRAANAFCSDSQFVDLTDIYKAIAKAIMGDAFEWDDVDSRIRRANLKARTRMLKLFDLARDTGGMVLSTDNLTELLLGFWTLHGDVGNYGMIQNFWKTEVYMATKYMAQKYRLSLDKAKALNATVTAIPTDGLGITNSDFDQILPTHDKSMLPEDVYRIIDEILMSYVYGACECKRPPDVIKPVIDRYQSTHFKRKDPYSIPRKSLIG